MEIEKANKKPDKKATRVSIPKFTGRARKRGVEEAPKPSARKRSTRGWCLTNMYRDDSIIEARTVEEAIA
ncbi:coiled-coil domain-containing protein 124 [Fagus crenata]